MSTTASTVKTPSAVKAANGAPTGEATTAKVTGTPVVVVVMITIAAEGMTTRPVIISVESKSIGVRSVVTFIITSAASGQQRQGE
jgi:hypothetical protein